MELVVVVSRSGDRGHALDHGHAGGRRMPVAVVIVVVAVGVALAVVVGFEAKIRQRERLARYFPLSEQISINPYRTRLFAQKIETIKSETKQLP